MSIRTTLARLRPHRGATPDSEAAYPAIKRLLSENGSTEVELDVDTEIMVRLFDTLGRYLGDAPNYREASVYVKPKGKYDWQAITITAQRLVGLSPHALRQQAERERDEALAEAARLREYVTWLAREPCQYIEDNVTRCSGDLTLAHEERCMPCQARGEVEQP